MLVGSHCEYRITGHSPLTVLHAWQTLSAAVAEARDALHAEADARCAADAADAACEAAELAYNELPSDHNLAAMNLAQQTAEEAQQKYEVAEARVSAALEHPDAAARLGLEFTGYFLDEEHANVMRQLAEDKMPLAFPSSIKQYIGHDIVVRPQDSSIHPLNWCRMVKLLSAKYTNRYVTDVVYKVL